MANDIPSLQAFAYCVGRRELTSIDRAAMFLYYFSVILDEAASIKQIHMTFEDAGLSKPNITQLRKRLAKDTRTFKTSGERWRLKNNMITTVEK